MRALALGVTLSFALNGCGFAKRPLTEAAFQSARVECGAQDAYIMKLPDRRAIGFKGFAPNHMEQAKCLSQKLKGTNASIAFISEPPVP